MSSYASGRALAGERAPVIGSSIAGCRRSAGRPSACATRPRARSSRRGGRSSASEVECPAGLADQHARTKSRSSPNGAVRPIRPSSCSRSSASASARPSGSGRGRAPPRRRAPGAARGPRRVNERGRSSGAGDDDGGRPGRSTRSGTKATLRSPDPVGEAPVDTGRARSRRRSASGAAGRTRRPQCPTARWPGRGDLAAEPVGHAPRRSPPRKIPSRLRAVLDEDRGRRARCRSSRIAARDQRARDRRRHHSARTSSRESCEPAPRSRSPPRLDRGSAAACACSRPRSAPGRLRTVGQRSRGGDRGRRRITREREARVACERRAVDERRGHRPRKRRYRDGQRIAERESGAGGVPSAFVEERGRREEAPGLRRAAAEHQQKRRRLDGPPVVLMIGSGLEAVRPPKAMLE